MWRNLQAIPTILDFSTVKDVRQGKDMLISEFQKMLWWLSRHYWCSLALNHSLSGWPTVHVQKSWGIDDYWKPSIMAEVICIYTPVSHSSAGTILRHLFQSTSQSSSGDTAHSANLLENTHFISYLPFQESLPHSSAGFSRDYLPSKAVVALSFLPWLVWLSCLECHPVHRKVVGWISGEGTCLSCEFDPWSPWMGGN